ncbi:MAG: DUF1549 domain-containing protein [Chthoniobacter sp.]|nr:DUF1549 domain-containing protein [Chthoniobacter sp.]
MRFLLLLPLLVLNARAFSPEELQLSAEARGVLAHSCTKCHGQNKQKGGLRLDTKEAVLKGGDDGAVLTPGKPAESDLLRRVLLAKGHEDAMPPKDGPLDSRDLETLRKWVAAGAPWPDGETAGVVFQRAPIAPRKPEFPSGTEELANPVDKFVAGYFRERKMAWPQPVDDRTFLRRATLDLVGLLPTWAEAQEFTGDRAAVVDALLARRHDYAARWFTMWNDALRNDFSGTGYIDGGRRQISNWLFTALRDDKPFDAFVRELVAPPSPESEGFIKGIVWRGSVSAAQTREMQAAQSVSQVFLGLNLKCASCHDSFISDYKLRDAYALAAIFADKPLEIARCDKPTGESSGPGFFWPELGTPDAAKPRAERQQQLAALLTKKENGRLARTLVNRLWAECFGRGLVEPVDSMDNPPWSRDLLDWLAWDFAESGWNVKHTLALIATSRTYALPAVAVADSESLGKASFVFSGPVVRRLSAEQFADAVSRVAAPLYAQANLKLAGEKDAALAKDAAWIWHSEGDSPATNFPVGKRYFRTTVTLPPGKVEQAAVVATADNGFTLHVNGRDVMFSTNFEVAKRADVTDAAASAPKLTIAVEANNTSPGAAGVRLALAVKIAGRKTPFIVETNADWRTTDERAEGWEKPGFDDGAWQPAVVADADPQWARVREFRLTFDTPAFVRAALVESDPLQSTLGRPIRDQVTMSRASQATLLQALTLTNGQAFSSALNKAADAWNARVSDPQARLTELYHAAFLRDPRPDELAFASTATNDLLWAIVLQPEFQLIR